MDGRKSGFNRPYVLCSRVNVRGFTLLEIMIVLLLMGLLVGSVSLNFNRDDPDRTLQQQARRFQVVISMLSDQAVMTQSQFGLYVEDQRYWFAKLDEDQRWQPLDGDEFTREKTLEQPFSLQLQLSGLSWSDDSSLFTQGLFDEELSVSKDSVSIGEDEEVEPLPPPQVYISSSGELTDFSLVFKFEPEYGEKLPFYYRVNCQGYGRPTISERLDEL